VPCRIFYHNDNYGAKGDAMKNRLSVTGKAAGTAAEASESRTRTAPAVERTTENGTDLHLPDEASVSAARSNQIDHQTSRSGTACRSS